MKVGGTYNSDQNVNTKTAGQTNRKKSEKIHLDDHMEGKEAGISDGGGEREMRGEQSCGVRCS